MNILLKSDCNLPIRIKTDQNAKMYEIIVHFLSNRNFDSFRYKIKISNHKGTFIGWGSVK